MVASWSLGEITVLYKLPLFLGKLQCNYSVPGRLTRHCFSGEFQTHFSFFLQPSDCLLTFPHDIYPLPVNLLSRRTFSTALTFWTEGECELDEGDWHCCLLDLERWAGLDERVSRPVHVLWLLSHPCGCHTCEWNITDCWPFFLSRRNENESSLTVR